MSFRRQSDPSGARKSKGPSYFTFSPGDQAVGHSGFDKLLRWAEIDFPSNPVYADPNALPQLRLPDTVVEEKLVEHFQRQHLSSRAPSRLNMGRVHAASTTTRHQPNHHEPLTAPINKPQIDTTSPSNIKGRRPAARKSLERQWIAVAQQCAAQQQQQQLQLHYQQRQQLAAGAPATSSSAPSSVPVSAMHMPVSHQQHQAAIPGAGGPASAASQTAAFVPQKFSV